MLPTPLSVSVSLSLSLLFISLCVNCSGNLLLLTTLHPSICALPHPSMHREEEGEEGEETPRTESNSEDDDDNEERETKPFNQSVIR